MKTDYSLHARARHRPGVLARMTSMFYRRALNIRTLHVGEEEDDGLVPIHVRVRGEPGEIERLTLSVQNLIDVDRAWCEPFTGGAGPGT